MGRKCRRSPPSLLYDQYIRGSLVRYSCCLSIQQHLILCTWPSIKVLNRGRPRNGKTDSLFIDPPKQFRKFVLLWVEGGLRWLWEKVQTVGLTSNRPPQPLPPVQGTSRRLTPRISPLRPALGPLHPPVARITTRILALSSTVGKNLFVFNFRPHWLRTCRRRRGLICGNGGLRFFYIGCAMPIFLTIFS